jgi:hypothetical protein
MTFFFPQLLLLLFYWENKKNMIHYTNTTNNQIILIAVLNIDNHVINLFIIYAHDTSLRETMNNLKTIFSLFINRHTYYFVNFRSNHSQMSKLFTSERDQTRVL